MSLVAYGCESEESDDESMDVDVAPLDVHPHSTQSAPLSRDHANKNDVGQPKITSFADDNEGELEDIVRPKSTQISLITKPVRKKGQPARISIPALVDVDEGDKPSAKKLKLSSTKCGLFDLLPAPQNASIKEAGRILLPHSLMKKKTFRQEMTAAFCAKPTAAGKNETAMKKKLKQTTVGVDYDSDTSDEGNDINFFSLPEGKSETTIDNRDKDSNTGGGNDDTESDPNSRLLCTNVYKTPLSDDDDDDGENIISPSDLNKAGENVSDIPTPSITVNSQPSYADLPLQFASYSNASKSAWKATNTPFSNYQAYSAVAKIYDSLDVEKTDKSEAPGTSEAESSSGDSNLGPHPQVYGPEPDTGLSSFNDDAEFLRIQGRRGRMKEEVHMIDVDCNDYTGNLDLTNVKNMSQEVPESLKHAKKDDAPTSQQRKKHQITYLAFQAKERELDLKNQWSQNRTTKRQTQAKYGF